MWYLPFARIALRYLSGFLAGAGVIDMQTAALVSTDPDLAMILAGALGLVASEVGYFFARKRGGAT